MRKKKISIVIIATLLVSLLFAMSGCGKKDDDEKLDLGSKAKSSNYSKWNGKYVCSKEDTVDGDTTYDDVTVEVEDGYISITFKHYYEDGDTSDDNVECDYTEKEDGKAIFAKGDLDIYELRKLGGKYYLNELDSDGDVSEKYELTKGGELPTHVFAKQTQAEEKAKPAKKPKKAKKKKAKKKKAKKSSSSGVSANVKEVMDEYEDFIDEYVEFMDEYSNASATDQAGMIEDYTEMMSDYSEWAGKVSTLNSNMSGADLAYYNKVMNRCNKKLADVSQY